MMSSQSVARLRHKIPVIAALVVLLISCNRNVGGRRQIAERYITGNFQHLTGRDTAAKGSAPVISSGTTEIRRYKEKIAPFKIRLVDGKGFTYKNLEQNKDAVLVYFEPDCPKCQAFAAALARKINQLSKIQIILISFADIRDVKQFDRRYKLSGHPNLRIGSEGYTFIVQQYYQIKHFPFVASYNRSGKLVRVLDANLKAEEMVARM